MGDAASAIGVRSEEAEGGGTDVWSAGADADAGVRFEESAAGGTDVWSDASAACPADHLVVMVHGILGSTADWQYGAKQFVESLGEKIVVHCSERNMYRLTLDGVDVMGERLAEEVLEVLNGKPEVKRISFVAHSVGGLVARYAIGRLYRPIRKLMKEDVACDDNSEGTICGLEPMNFITVATPHLGSRGNNQVPFLFGVTAVEKVASLVVHWIFRRTGRHLFLTDNAGGQPPLLQRMVDDCGDLYFMSALRAFKRRVVYANVGYDHIVGWRTSSIRRNSELPKLDNSSNEKYPHIVHEEHSKGSNVDEGVQISATNDPCEEHSKGSNVDEGVQISATNDPFDMIEEMMVTALSRLSWERVDVSFQSSMQRFAAHSVIQVKFSFMESDGADVIRHMIDHFLT